MKKALSILTLALVLLSTQKIYAQQPAIKIGVFDMDLMVQAMPGYKIVDSLMQVYNRDSLGAEYEIYQNEFQRLDSTFKADSAAKKSATVLNYTNNQRRQVGMNLVYWQQIAQQKSDNRRAALADPLYVAVANAYKKVLTARKYTLILKPNTYELGSQIENVFPYVAKELNIQLPAELGGGAPVSDTKPGGKTTPVKKK
jgi:Skp family chaperone for outer membrane proteins